MSGPKAWSYWRRKHISGSIFSPWELVVLAGTRAEAVPVCTVDAQWPNELRQTRVEKLEQLSGLIYDTLTRTICPKQIHRQSKKRDKVPMEARLDLTTSPPLPPPLLSGGRKTAKTAD